MQININLTEEHIIALLNQFNSIEGYVQKIVESKANQIIMQDGC